MAAQVADHIDIAESLELPMDDQAVSYHSSCFRMTMSSAPILTAQPPEQ